jgi:hypothetical protein
LRHKPKFLYAARLAELTETFQHIQDEAIREGVRVVKAYEVVRDGDKIDFGAHMSHRDMISLCNTKTGFIIWLIDDFDLNPNVIFPEDGAQGAADMAKCANFLLLEGAGGILKAHKTHDADFSYSYFYGRNSDHLLLPEKLLLEQWLTPESVLQWRR